MYVWPYLRTCTEWTEPAEDDDDDRLVDRSIEFRPTTRTTDWAQLAANFPYRPCAWSINPHGRVFGYTCNFFYCQPYAHGNHTYYIFGELLKYASEAS